MSDLSKKSCVACEGGVPALSAAEAQKLVVQLDNWLINKDHTEISKTFSFKNFFRTMSFVNAVAHIANEEGHHPDMHVSYAQCRITFQTHSVKGLTENDFICAAKIDKLQQLLES